MSAHRPTSWPTIRIGDDEADAALANWRICVAQGRPSALNGVFYLAEGSGMSEAEWADRYVTEH